MTLRDFTDIGFIGTGVMGRHMATHLLDAGHRLHIHNRTRAKAEPLLERGAIWYDRPGELAPEAQIIFTIVGYPEDVEAIYFNDQGLLHNAKPETIFVDMTTSDPTLAQRIAQAAEAQQCMALDAPVSGGDRGAREAALSIMVGGPRDAFDAAQPLFERMGQNIVYQGQAGSGQHCKMCNQIAIASNMLGVCEAIAYAHHAGLDPHTVLQSISTGAAGSWSLSHLAPRMLQGDFDPGFYIKHFIKDMTIALKAAEKLNLQTPGLALAKSLYEQLQSAGHGDEGTQALYRWYQQQHTPHTHTAST